MSRDASGNYTLPAGNPVVTSTSISSSVQNTTMSDVATTLTDSLSRTGLGGMSAQFKAIDGTVAAPGISYSNELGSGFYRIGAANIGFAVTGTKVLDVTTAVFNITATTAQVNGTSIRDTAILTSGTLADARLSANVPLLNASNIFTQTWVNGTLTAPIRLSSASPTMFFNETDQAAGEKNWVVSVNTKQLQIFTADDTGNFVKAALNVTAGAAGAISTISLGNATDKPTVNVNGQPILKTAAVTTTAGNGTISGTSYGITSISHPGTGSYTVNITAAGFTVAPVVVVSCINGATGCVFANATSATSVTVIFRDATQAAAQDGNFNLIAIGQ